MRAVPLPKAKMNVTRLAVLLKRVSLGLGLLVGLSFLIHYEIERRFNETVPSSSNDSNLASTDPRGAWRGNWGRYPALLILDGEPHQLEGNIELFLPGGHSVRLHAQGAFDTNLRTVQLDDTHPQSSQAGTYQLQLSADGMSLIGHIDTHHGDRVEFRMVRL